MKFHFAVCRAECRPHGIAIESMRWRKAVARALSRIKPAGLHDCVSALDHDGEGIPLLQFNEINRLQAILMLPMGSIFSEYSQ